jgi:hypothetical protein
MEIDLHLTKDIINSPYFDPKDALTIQIGILEKELDNAILMNLSEMTIIHGIGEGVLKKEVQKVLKKHPSISEIKDEYGKTKVTFK